MVKPINSVLDQFFGEDLASIRRSTLHTHTHYNVYLKEYVYQERRFLTDEAVDGLTELAEAVGLGVKSYYANWSRYVRLTSERK